MNKLYVIGAGPGNENNLTIEAIKVIEEAAVIWCADRNSPLIPPDKRRPLTPFNAVMDEIETELERGICCAVVLSGDTGLYSMLEIIKKRFGNDKLQVISGLSSIQTLCAKLNTNWQDAKILSAHGRPLKANMLCHYARVNSKTLVLLDNEKNPKWIHDTLQMGGLENLKLIIGERLSYEDECIAPYEAREYNPLAVAMIINDSPESDQRPVGLDDNTFIRGKIPMTKREIRAQVISNMCLEPDSVVWDIGAGTGSVSIECALNCPFGEVYAIERDQEALKLIEQNKSQFHALNINIVPGEAPTVLKGLPLPSHVFLGGTGGKAEAILALLESLGKPIHLCATAVTIESASLLTKSFAKYTDFSACHIVVTRLDKAGEYSLFHAQNPVFVFKAKMGGGR